MREFDVDAGGYRVAVRDWGGDGQDLVLLHGGGGNLESFAELAPMLLDKFHVVGFDSFGCGRSELPDELTPDLPQRELAAAIGELGLRRPLLAGSSLGGMVSLRYAAEGGACAGIVAIDGAAVLTRDEVDALPPFDAAEYAEAIRRQGWGWCGAEAEIEQRVAARVAEGDAPSLPLEASARRAICDVGGGMFEERPNVEHIVAMRAMAPTIPIELRTVEVYERVTVPILLLCAERGVTGAGPYTPAQRRRVDELPARHPNVEVEWLDTGHLVHWERPQEIADRIARFVTDG